MTPILSIWPDAATELLAVTTGSFLKEPVGSYGSLYDNVTSVCISARELAGKISDIFRALITLTMTDTTLHIICVIPLYSPAFNDKLQTITEACAICPDKVSLHVIALRSTFIRILGQPADGEPDDESLNINKLIQQSQHGPFHYTHTIIDDYAANGAPLGFTLHSLSEYLAIIFAAMMRDYHAVLPPAMLSAADTGTIAFGVSSLRLDRDTICAQLLHRAFIDSLDKAGLNHTTVDAQKASHKSDTLLRDIDKRYTAFYDSHVLPPFRDYNKSESEIVSLIAKPLDEEFNDIRLKLTSFLHDSSILFPEKEGILALLLGRDNPKLTGVQYDRKTLLIDDACSVPVDQYVKAFNSNDPTPGVIPLRGEYPALKKYFWDIATESLEDSSENAKAFNPLPEIKRLKLEILNTTAFIRQKNDELDSLTRADENRRQAEKEAMPTVGHSTPHRLQKDISEQPLADTYHPDSSVKPKSSVDLRQFFSPVRDQASVGSCSTFAVVAMFEATMNRCSGNSEKADMSEQFVYYFSNVITGHPEGGSNFFDQFAVLGQHGICHENLYGYSLENLTIAPSKAAIEDALNHRVLKARQIQLRSEGDKTECLKENHRLLTSALSEGYPVGISLKLYPSFGKSGAFINRPDNDDLAAGDEGYHAMVIAGYSDSEKCYIVRNSWGAQWGDKGYCYISAAYIDDPEYNSFACIIAEISDSVQGNSLEIPPLVAGFAGSETEIRIAAIRNVLDEAHIILESQRKLYDENYRYYQHLMQRLAMPQVRNNIRKSAEDKSAEKFLDIASQRNSLNDSYMSDLNEFRHEYIKGALYLTIWTIIFNAGTIWLAWPPKMSWSWITSILLIIVTVFTWLNYRWAIRKKRRELNERLAKLAQIEERARRDLTEKQLQFHVAGMWIDRFQKLSIEIGTIYDRLFSFNGYLKGWYEDDIRLMTSSPRHEGSMFINIVPDSSLIDRCYTANRDSILRNIDLMDTFDRYTIEQETIQESRKRLKEDTLAAIRPIFADFRISDYMDGQEYPYLKTINLADETGRLISVGQPSLRHSSVGISAPMRILLLDITDSVIPGWLDKVGQFFPMRPVVITTSDPCTCHLISIQTIPVL